MDTENMHPFCLPFGLCHDATSSNLTTTTADLSLANQTNSRSNATRSNKLLNIIDDGTNKTNSDNKRSRSSSPANELFEQLNNNNNNNNNNDNITSPLALSSTSSSLLNQHDFMISSLNDIIGCGPDESLFYSSLEYVDTDINDSDNDEDNDENRLSKSSIVTSDIEYADSDHKLKEEEEEEEEDDDWCCDGYPFKYSPTRRKLSSSIRTATLYNQQQVFQHLVDPIDIKSSPTLAQLNLNSSDDPIDAFWDSNSVNSNHNSTSIIASSNCPDLLSNCTSINKNSLITRSCCGHIFSNNRNHLSQSKDHHHHNHHHQINDYCNHHTRNHNNHHTHHLSSSTHLASCHNAHNNQHQQSYQMQELQQQQQEDRCPSSMQSTCLAVDPFRKSTDPPQQPSCCHHNQTVTNHSSLNSNSNGKNLKPSATLNQLNQQTIDGTNSTTTTTTTGNAALDKRTTKNCPQLQRPISPALVTSSSSPLSSSAQQGCQQQNQFVETITPVQDTNVRQVDNKLKENIEYLTALLCNGNNNLENNNLQPNISSTMARSYTTLAHTLSTGPKLLERSQEFTLGATNQRIFNPTNEAASCIDINRPTSAQGIKRPHSNVQWFNSAVESSISAADSTESQLSRASKSNHDSSMNICSQQQQQQQQSQSSLSTLNQNRQQQGQSELGVLSSLLTGTKTTLCNTNHITPITATPPSNNSQQQNTRWNQQPQYQQTMEQSSGLSGEPRATVSIPPNGRPITLTPIASHNNPILQQQAAAFKTSTKSSPFIQPASPSASSTASSGANTDIGSSSGSSPINKRPRVDAGKSQTQYPQSNSSTSSSTTKGQKSDSNGPTRSARPSSLSTDCSVSSHDEGFSSTIDNSEDMSNRDDSDDDDEVDSDDESFYGDYTNSDLIGASISDDLENKWTLNMGRTRRNGQKRYFWQYNVQSKGPKGTRICPTDESEDPFVLPEASDPVFSNDCQIEGVKHSGKARRGDGNDLTPNPRKLLMIGLELKKLSKIINELAPVTDLPINARTKTRKEKNKLASRACRLKKKAQHEANKIKLYGLQREHQQVVMAIYDIRKLLNQALAQKNNLLAEGYLQAAQQQQRLDLDPVNRSQLNTPATTLSNNHHDNGSTTTSKVYTIAEQCSLQVAGQTSDFVNSVLEKVVSGCIDGGLET